MARDRSRSGSGGASGGIRRPPRQRPRRRHQYVWHYVCTFTDPTTGEVIGTSMQTVITDSGTNYQRASANARRTAIAAWTQRDSPPHDPGQMYRMSCRRVGQIVEI